MKVFLRHPPCTYFSNNSQGTRIGSLFRNSTLDTVFRDRFRQWVLNNLPWTGQKQFQVISVVLDSSETSKRHLKWPQLLYSPAQWTCVPLRRAFFHHLPTSNSSLPCVHGKHRPPMCALSRWNDHSHEATQNLMQYFAAIVQFLSAVSNLSLHGRCVSRSLHDSTKIVISRLLARNCCGLAVVVGAIFASQSWPGGEVVISRSLPLWHLRGLNWDTRKS